MADCCRTAASCAQAGPLLQLQASRPAVHAARWQRSASATSQRPSAAPAAAAQQRRQCRHQQSERGLRCLRLEALRVEAPSESMAPEAAWALLEEFTAKEARGLAQALLDSQEKRRRLRDALLVAAAAPHPPAGWNPLAAAAADGAATTGAPEVLLGVVASDVRLAVRSLRDYCQALGLPFKMPESRVPGVAAAPAITGAVYVKYNSSSGLCYATKYEGRDRGVLVQLGQRQLGHLPLGLHDEAMAKPPPAALG